MIRENDAPKYRNLGVSAIAKCLDPDYKLSRKSPQTSEEVKQNFENRKDDLLKYCKDILSGIVLLPNYPCRS